MKPLQPFSVVAPGFKGLNTQDSSVTLESGFCLEAWNSIIDKQGRLSSRKGYVNRTSVSAALGSNAVKALHEFVKNDGTTELLSAGNNKIFRGNTTLTDITLGGGYVVNNSNWIFSNLNSKSYLFQNGQEPLVYADIGAGYVLTAMTAYPGYVVPSVGVSWTTVKTGISALGRIWCATDQTVYFSDLLQGWVWNGGTSGSLNVSNVWPDGTDTIQALAVHNNFLIIFGRRSILVYSSADVPSNLRLEDTVVGTGCLSQQTVQNIGTDLLFISDNGLRSFSRIIQEQSLPMRDLSKNVRDDFLQSVLNENVNDLRTVYFEKDAFYLVLCPSIDQTWCFDTRGSLEDGSLRVTRWDKSVYTAFCATRDRKLYVGIVGYIAEYFGYNDGAGRYTMKYRSNYFDMGNANSTVIPKKLSMIVVTADSQDFVFKWGFDYSPVLEGESAEYEGLGVYEYGVAEYGVAEYTSGETLGNIEVNPGGDGTILQVGFDTDISGARVSVQKFSVYVKQGRVI